MATFRDRVANADERRQRLVSGVETAFAPLREFLDEIRDQPGYALVDVSLDRSRATMDGRVAGSFVSPPLGGGEGAVWHDFEVRPSSPQGGVMTVSRPGSEGAVELAYGNESREGRSSLTAEIRRMRRAFDADCHATAPCAPAGRTL